MNTIPIDSNRLGSVLATSVIAATDQDGQQRSNTQGVPLWKIECLIRPPARPDGSSVRASVELVTVPGQIPPKLSEMTPVVFEELVARHWEMGGRSGVSLSAQSVRRQGGE